MRFGITVLPFGVDLVIMISPWKLGLMPKTSLFWLSAQIFSRIFRYISILLQCYIKLKMCIAAGHIAVHSETLDSWEFMESNQQKLVSKSKNPVKFVGRQKKLWMLRKTEENFQQIPSHNINLHVDSCREVVRLVSWMNRLRGSNYYVTSNDIVGHVNSLHTHTYTAHIIVA